MAKMLVDFAPIVERHERLGDSLGLELLVVRDDLLPFPLPGNKVRKLERELRDSSVGEVLLSNGGIDSNHCRTLALYGARLGLPVHLVLHSSADQGSASFDLLDLLGASYDVVTSAQIGSTLDRVETAYHNRGTAVRRIAGGCHTPAGAMAYRDVGLQVIEQHRPDVIVVASGTGATHGGLAAAAHGSHTEVIGVSVARNADRGIAAVLEAAGWAGAPTARVKFADSFVDGGYGQHGLATTAAVAHGWSFGLPLDPTYTGKAFAAMADDEFRDAYLRNKRVVFWHTGGLMNLITDGVQHTARRGVENG